MYRKNVLEVVEIEKHTLAERWEPGSRASVSHLEVAFWESSSLYNARTVYYCPVNKTIKVILHTSGWLKIQRSFREPSPTHFNVLATFLRLLEAVSINKLYL